MFLGALMRILSIALVAVAATVGLSPAASAQSWTGFYAGVNIGYSWGNSDTGYTFSNAATGAVAATAASKGNLDGVIGGGQLGYNWRSGVWVFGVETDFQGSGQKGTQAGACAGGSLAQAPATLFSSACAPGHVGDTAPFNTAAFPVLSSISQKLEWFGTLRGRVGYTFTPTWVGYATGGLAYGNIETTNTISGTNITGPQGTNTVILTSVLASSRNSATQAGWTLGAGLEGILSGRWSGKIEYIYMDLGHVSGSFVTPIISTSGALLVASYRSHITDHILRVGFNYKLDGAP
jgi:outer membrane immunogenic protein